LSDEFTVVARDAPGCGSSSDPPGVVRLADYADAMAAFIGILGLGRPCVLGHSFGGALVLELYRRHARPSRCLISVCGPDRSSLVVPGRQSAQEVHGCAEMHSLLHFLVALRGLRLALLAVWRDPETKALPVVVGVLLVSGTVFYWAAEDWSLIQSLYFSVVTLTTVGYGDLTPTSDYSRIFTIIYILIGVGVLVLSSLAKHYIRHKVEVAHHAQEHLSAVTRHGQPPDEGGSQ
jgi:pimeloyl-ACP methyl ester carboxylesterase